LPVALLPPLAIPQPQHLALVAPVAAVTLAALQAAVEPVERPVAAAVVVVVRSTRLQPVTAVTALQASF